MKGDFRDHLSVLTLPGNIRAAVIALIREHETNRCIQPTWKNSQTKAHSPCGECRHCRSVAAIAAVTGDSSGE